MLTDPYPRDERPADVEPTYSDLVTLTPAAAHGAPAADHYVIVDLTDHPDSGVHTVADPEARPVMYVLWLPEDHPQHQDWAMSATREQIASVVRHTEDGVQTWRP
ncbi:DUF6211 family protein [Kitasatospora sp. NPDC058048]|uniref:DUF6211 family protein n=1 Tax=Kitasatospora sp. NPDC058048 TaxID=3346313 RepID=UPI0036D84C34